MRGTIHKIVIAYSFLLLPALLQGQQSVVLPASVEAIGSSGASLGWGESFWLNAAASARSGFAIGLNYSNRFLLKDLSSASVYLVMPVNDSRMMASIGQFGNEAFRENQITAGLSKAFGERLSYGLLFHYFRFSMAESSRHPELLTFSLGIQYQQGDYGLGVACFNPLSIKMNVPEVHDDYPFLFRVGAHRVFQDHLLVAGQLSYCDEYGVNVHCGLQYELQQRLYLRAGVQTRNSEWAFGIGYLVGVLQADLAFSYHEYLGFSPIVTLCFKQP
ncbi:hypothetical protein [Mangrovibacterium sp.]|uniref:hypothetical protein n=1 Tax=Mangrovibacterium sp. TaxID=1961364 RepID=UPI00356A946D